MLKNEKIAVISIVAVLVALALGLIFGLIFGLDDGDEPLNAEYKILTYPLHDTSLTVGVKNITQQMLAINQDGALSFKGGIQEQTFQVIQNFKFKASLPLTSLIELACTRLGQDGNKIIESDSGLFEFYEAVLLTLGKGEIDIQGLSRDKVIFSEVDILKNTQIEYDEEKGTFKFSKLDQEPAGLDSSAEQKPLSKADLPQCQKQKAVPLIVQNLKELIKKHIEAYKREIDNGGKEVLQALVAAQSGDSQNQKKKQFKQNCIYVNEITYICNDIAIESVIKEDQSNLQGMAQLESGQPNRFETESLKFVLEI